MALDRTWYTRAEILTGSYGNNSTAALLAKSIVFGLKALLKQELAGGTVGTGGAPPGSMAWAHKASSDGLGNVSTVTDLWTATFDQTKIVPGAGGTNHSWILLESPAALGPAQFLIDFSATSSWYLYGAFGTLFTGGTATARPTSSKEFTICSNAAFAESVTTDHRIGYSTCSDGSFYFLVNKVGAALFNMSLFVGSLDGVRAGDLSVYGHFNYHMSGRGAPICSSAPIGRDTVNGAAGNNLWNYTNSFANSVPLNYFDTKVDLYQPLVMTYNNPNGGLRGKMPDMRFIAYGCSPGRGLPTDVAMERVSAGEAAIPWSVPPAL